MNTTIAQINGKWYVVKSNGRECGMNVWVKISPAFNTSFEARSYQADIIFGRVKVS